MLISPRSTLISMGNHSLGVEEGEGPTILSDTASTNPIVPRNPNLDWPPSALMGGQETQSPHCGRPHENTISRYEAAEG
jgi:hypothetical protein